MNAERTRSPIELSSIEIGFVWLCRIIAVYCLFLGVAYWIRLIGVHEGDLWRFDLMPEGWKAAAAALAILFPVAATGMWMLAPWGPVIWIGAAVTESLIYTMFDGTFGYRPMVAFTHGLMIVLYVGLRVTIYWQKRHPDEPEEGDDL